MRILLVLAAVACSQAAPKPQPTSTGIANRVEAGPTTIALAVVFNGQEIWVGNEEHESDENARYLGALHGLVGAFDAHPPATTFAPGSQGLVVSYSTGADVMLPLGPLSRLTGQTFGTQKQYRNRIGTDLILGLDAAFEALAAATTSRRAILLIGDGNDTNNELARAQLATMKRKAAAENTAIYALIIKSAVSMDGEIVSLLTSNTRHLKTNTEITSALADIWRELEAPSPGT